MSRASQNTSVIFSLLIFSLLIIGCSTSGHRYININPPPFGAQSVPGQINTLLVNSGFERIEFSARVGDPNAGAVDSLNMKTGEVLESPNKFFMRYQHQTYPDLLVNVAIGRDKGDVKLEFYETDNKELSIETMNIYNQFKENLKSGLYDENDFSES